ncbi:MULTISPECIES: isopenicillin N synthase family oxygenase [unclassified Colwellia]|uniref:isopenicillin N synthase family oxygenase n=1 Tax=unclassified Colwellia TaxID=196834 RepID=UPI0015F4BB42|nr:MULTISPECIES: isopenicillin N synthase family oxygenase [unclassified Colwellia]MBA6232880.1 isopenicillin N synthase family oxygenase [Colwellia sp. MB02u-7]MBA6237014.1 isopenicillin N synthase family oxygenase [Colwellia sp. MB02u-11]MBA6258200.1 isopenicillin N synthase family oxygenase [Colwellia sp. MB3u-28]MBA6259627.1 isopenicillin N synthase family oxygenase [Colwellia sp. MB3u-41]MBA6299507.1 isopenicillin N synthase family oxygenase [Colwellia sp. MB3u-22]
MQIQVVDYQDKNAAKLFVQSLRETGFGVLINHPIQQQVVESIYKNWYEFFSSEEKHTLNFDPQKQDGYFSTEISETAKGHANKDIKEYFHVYPWGRIPEQLKAEILSYYNNASELAAELLDWVEKYSPVEVSSKYSEQLSNMIKDTPNTLLRILHYPPLKGDEEPGAVRAAAHEDINLLTILPAANEPGLQVQQQDGSWIDVPSDFGSLIINIGDMLQEASGGYFPSTSHRVINPSGKASEKSRISLPLFLHPRDEVVLSDRHTQKSYLLERLKELGVK